MKNFIWSSLTVLIVFFSLWSYDANQEKVQYIMGYTHLDTQWRWTVQRSINEYLRNTLYDNFELFEKYPDYEFNFEGAYRYMKMKECYPDAWVRLKEYVEQGRWHIAGCSVDAMDVLLPSAESLIRQRLYAAEFYKQEFGYVPVDILLPDCFGFPYSLPTIGNHCGAKGFSTQKLSWGGAVPAPFACGRWVGVDGSSLVSVLRPGAYTSNFDIREDQINELGNATGFWAAMDYFGVGDRGGAPPEDQVQELMARIAQNDQEDIKVDMVSSDELFRDLSESQIADLPVYEGELLMEVHGTGCYTSQAGIKLLNRKCERIAFAAEEAAVIAHWLGVKGYPRDKLTDAWIRFLPHQMHDDLTGTSVFEAYDYTRGSYIASLNDFRDVLNNSLDAVSSLMDTESEGVSVVVYNSLPYERQDLVDTTINWGGSDAQALRVYNRDGIEVPSQCSVQDGGSWRIVFLADAPSAGMTVYNVKEAASSCAIETGLSVSESEMENSRYRILIDGNGDISSICDKLMEREILDRPIRLALLEDNSNIWPAWEVLPEDLDRAPRAYVDESVEKAVVEDGPARVCLEIRRTKDGSEYVQKISLGAGESGDIIDIGLEIDWSTYSTMCKAVFPLSLYNQNASYDMGVGVIERGTNSDYLHEVPAQQWADMTDNSGSWGVSLFSDCKYGWDKPSDNTLRLTLVRTPSAAEWYTDQSELDIGHHVMNFAVYPHEQDWNSAQTVSRARRYNQPLVAHQEEQHQGSLGKSFSFFTASKDISCMGIKLAQKSDDIVVRFRETGGVDRQDAVCRFAAPVAQVSEYNGLEEELAGAAAFGDTLPVDIGYYGIKAYALSLEEPENTFEKTIAGIRLSPDIGSIAPGDEIQFSAAALDRFGQKLPVQPDTWNWQVTGGTVTDGFYQAPSSEGGPFTLTVTEPQSEMSGAFEFTCMERPVVDSGIIRDMLFVETEGSRYLPNIVEKAVESEYASGETRPAEGDTLSVNGRKLLWSPGHSDDGIWLDENHDYFVAFAAVDIYSPEERAVKLIYDNDDALTVRINGDIVLFDDWARGDTSDTFTLDKGLNRVFVKLSEETVDNMLKLQMVHADGSPMTDLTYSIENYMDPVATVRKISRQNLVKASVLIPSRNSLRIKIGSVGNHNISIYTMNGRCCYHIRGNRPKTYTIQKSSFAAGAYLVKVKTIDKVETFKTLVVR